MLEIMLILLVIFAVAAINTRHLRHAVIYLVFFSLCISLVYLLYNAPDIAIAEAIIGSTLSTILYLVALQKYKIFTIYCKVDNIDEASYSDLIDNTQLMKTVKKFCTKQELEAQIIHSSLPLENIVSNYKYAIIIENYSYKFIIHGHYDNYQLEKLNVFLKNDPDFHDSFEINNISEVLE